MIDFLYCSIADYPVVPDTNSTSKRRVKFDTFTSAIYIFKQSHLKTIRLISFVS